MAGGKLAGLGLLRGPRGLSGATGPQGADGAGSGGGATTVASLTALRAVSPEPLTGAIYNVDGDPVPWTYDRLSGNGFPDDGETTVRISTGSTPVLLASNGRFYRQTTAPILPTMAALIAAVAGKHKKVHIQGHTILGDGGGGAFDDVTAISSTAHDGGVFVHAGTRIWKRRTDGEINVLWWGADKTGAASSTTAIQSACDFAFSQRVVTAFLGDFPPGGYASAIAGTVVKVPYGKYKLTRRNSTPGATGYRHALEIPGNIFLVGERGTTFVPDSSTQDETTGYAAIRTQLYDSYFAHITIMKFYVGLALFGHTVTYGTLGPASGVEHPSNVDYCYFLGCRLACWQDTMPVTRPDLVRTFQAPLKFRHCTIIGPHAFWGSGDAVSFHDCLLAMDQANFAPIISTGDRELSLGFICSTDRLQLMGNLLEVEGVFAGSPGWDPRACFLQGTGSISLENNTHFDRAVVTLRQEWEGTEYKGLAEAAVKLPTDASVRLELQIKGSTFNSVGLFWLECYDKFPRSIRVYGNDPLNFLDSKGIRVDDSVDLTTDILQISGHDLLIDIDERMPEFRRITYSSEANGYSAGVPVIDGPGVTDISNVFTTFYHNAASADTRSDWGSQDNLFYPGITDAVITGDAAHFAFVGGSAITADGTTSLTGVPLSKYKATGFGQDFRWTSPPVLAGMPAGVYNCSIYIGTDYEAYHTFGIITGTGLSAVQTNVAPRRLTATGTNYHQRIDFAFWYPGSGEFRVTGVIEHIPDEGHHHVGLFMINQGPTMAPYRYPVDSPVAPTTNHSSNVVVRRYQMPFKPNTGHYELGDVIEIVPPVAGDYSEYVCVVAGDAPDFVLEGRNLVANSADPTTITGTLRVSLLFNNSGGIVNAGDSTAAIVATLVGAERGADIKIVPYQDIGDGWTMHAEVADTDEVRYWVTNNTGVNAAVPTDAGGGVGLDVLIYQHPAFEDTFPEPAAWLTADIGYVAGTWTDQFGIGHGAGPQATAGKRPTLQTAMAALGGHNALRGIAANHTILPISWSLGSKNTLFFVLGGMSGAADTILLDDNAGNVRIFYNRSGHAKHYEFVSAGQFRDIGAVANHADYVVIGVTQDDAGNLKTYLNGSLNYSGAKDQNLSGVLLSFLFAYHVDTNWLDGDVAAVLWYKDVFSSSQMVEMTMRLKGKYSI